MFSCSDDEEDAISEDLDAALHSLQALTAQVRLGRASILVPVPPALRAISCAQPHCLHSVCAACAYSLWHSALACNTSWTACRPVLARLNLQGRS